MRNTSSALLFGLVWFSFSHRYLMSEYSGFKRPPKFWGTLWWQHISKQRMSSGTWFRGHHLQPHTGELSRQHPPSGWHHDMFGNIPETGYWWLEDVTQHHRGPHIKYQQQATVIGSINGTTQPSAPVKSQRVHPTPPRENTDKDSGSDAQRKG